MYFNEHNPPHFHAQYGEFNAAFSIKELSTIEGYLPKRVVALILEWGFEHRNELLENWNTLRDKKTFKKIEGLDNDE